MRLSAVIGILFLFMVSACDRGEEDIILVPTNFKGGILILFNQKSGKPTRYHDGKRVYEIPPDGILKTQFAPNYGWRFLTNFYRGSISASNRLPTYFDIERAPDSLLVGYHYFGTLTSAQYSSARAKFFRALSWAAARACRASSSDIFGAQIAFKNTLKSSRSLFWLM